MCRQGYRTGKTAEQTAWNIWSCATNISSTGLRKYKPPAGRKTRLRAWQLLMLMAHEVRLWRQKCFCVTFDKSNKTYSASDFACWLVFGWNMIRWEQIFM